ncbi:MAG TPA: amidase [Gemmatimonadaceae bacterium]|nr:amidase [Gemmatimonadaceae bacterium]
MTDLTLTPATELAAMLRSREVSARDVMAAHLARIAAVNPKVNAIVAKLDDDACLALADAADVEAADAERSGAQLPPLHGLPIAFKDLQPARGFPFTRGSPVFRDFMPAEDSVLVERLKAAGAIPIGKTNVPEFGMGSHTFNPVYGTTLNPYDLTKSAGGSSGGAAVALATGMLPIADGSDLGGSLRNPGNFNNVVGFRPTVGLVPTAPDFLPLLGFAVNGPLARTVRDIAFLMRVMAGPDPRDPGCHPSDPAVFTGSLERDVRGLRVAWCPDLGALPLDARVRDVLDAQRSTFEAMGCVVEHACPDLRDADSVFLTLRAFRTAAVLGPVLDANPGRLKAEAVAEIEAGRRLSGSDVSSAMMRHGQLLERMRRFEERFDVIACAVNQVPPFDARIDWPHEVAGTRMEHYVQWMQSAYWISATWRPAISVPAGFTPEGLPVGIQLVGRYRDDFALLQLAFAFEQATGVGARRPEVS